MKSGALVSPPNLYPPCYVSPIEPLMNEIFIYARPCVNKMTCSAVFSSLFLSTQKSTAMIKKLSRYFLEYSFVLVTQSNSKSGEDVSQIWKVCRKDWPLLGKRPQIGLRRKMSNWIKCPPFLTFVLYHEKQVNYKVSSTAKNYTLLLSPNNPTEAGKFLLQ